MDKRQKAIAKKDLPLGTYVKQLERMLDEGYQVEYLDLDDIKKKQYDFELIDDQIDLTEERRKANMFMSRIKQGFQNMLKNKIEKMKHEKLIKKQMKKQTSIKAERKYKRGAVQRIPLYEVVHFSKNY